MLEDSNVAGVVLWRLATVNATGYVFIEQLSPNIGLFAAKANCVLKLLLRL